MPKSAGSFFSGEIVTFVKPPKTYLEQLQILKSRGLTVHDETRAAHCLEHHNYYRLSAYRFPFVDPTDADLFKPGTTFDDLWNLYHFDRTLRRFVSDAVERFEVSVRARWAYVLGHAYGPQAYENPMVFRNAVRHTSALEKLDEELERSKEVFVTHYREKYKMSRPPIWAACEVMSFGLLSRFYENMAQESERKKIAHGYGLSARNLESLLKHCVYVRNLCAHHSRLWNRRFTVTVELPHSSPVPVIPNLNTSEPRRLYNTLVLLAHVVGVVEPESSWARHLVEHLTPLDERLILEMGFPFDWRTRPMWRALLPTS